MDNQPLTVESLDPVNRRRLLGLIGAGAAGTAIALLSADPAKAGHDGTNTLHLGEDNSVNAVTTLSSENLTDPPEDRVSLQVHTNIGRALGGASAFGVGVSGHSNAGEAPSFPPVGVEGTAHNDGIGVRGQSKAGEGTGAGAGAGVVGESGSGPGVTGDSQGGPGVAGHSWNSDGVIGISEGAGFGVVGNSTDGPGVLGHNLSGSAPGVWGLNDGDGPGVLAESANGPALSVLGPAHFSTAGAGVIPDGANSVFVASAAVTADSHISVTLAGDPGGNRVLQWVERDPGLGFTVHLSSAPPPARPATNFTYLIVEAM